MKKVILTLFTMGLALISSAAEPFVTFRPSPDGMAIASQGKPVNILVSSQDYEGVHIAVHNLQNDIQAVCGTQPALMQSAEEQMIIVGSLQSEYIQQMIADRNNKLVEFPILPKGTELAIQPRIVRMTEDMLQFAEEPRPIVILDANHLPMQAENPHHFFEASWLHKRGDKYYFSYSTGDTHMICYAVGDNPYGPFTYQGVLLEPVVGWTSHHSICEYRGQWYLFHHDSVPSGGKTWLRSLKVKSFDYDEEGRIII